jgi:hypothetical protein
MRLSSLTALPALRSEYQSTQTTRFTSNRSRPKVNQPRWPVESGTAAEIIAVTIISTGMNSK